MILQNHNLSSNNQTSITCLILNTYAYYVLNAANVIIAVIIPFVLMVAISTALIHFVVFKRKKFITKLTHTEVTTFNKDNKLAISVIGLNLMFFITQMPVNVLLALISYPSITLNLLLTDLWFIFFGADFFVYFSSNSMFRSELRLILSFFSKH